MPLTSVIVPWRPGCPHRQAAWAYLRLRWAMLGYEVILGRCPDGPWMKARAVADGLSRAAGDVLVVTDADVWCDGITDAVEQVTTRRPWAAPHDTVHRLTAEATADVLAGAELHRRTLRRPCLEQGTYRAHLGGGIVVVDRATYERVPLDPRFAGWGHEDDAWAIALAALVGPAWVGGAGLWHLWHPPQDRISRDEGSEASRALYARYAAANRTELEQIIAEAKEATPWP